MNEFLDLKVLIVKNKVEKYYLWCIKSKVTFNLTEKFKDCWYNAFTKLTFSKKVTVTIKYCMFKKKLIDKKLVQKQKLSLFLVLKILI